MGPCKRCAAINFDHGNLYALASVKFMISSARRGCSGCRFFLKATRHIDGYCVEDSPEMQVLLQHTGRNRVDLCFLESTATTLDLVHWTELSLCTTYGMELAPWAEYEEGEDEAKEGEDEDEDEDGEETEVKAEQEVEAEKNIQEDEGGDYRARHQRDAEGGEAEDKEEEDKEDQYEETEDKEDEDEATEDKEEEDKKVNRDDVPFLGRLVAENSSDEQCLDLAKSWLTRCTHYHGTVCAVQADNELPTRLIHVPAPGDGLPKLFHTSKDMRGRYAALSYCWGQGSTCKTTSWNIQDRMQGISLDELPRTLRDAMKLVHYMGIEWIWIDSLCILQDEDNLVDWTHESALMARIYTNAAFTVCVDWASGTDDGIFRPREWLKSHTFGSHGKLQLQPALNGWASMTHQALYYRGWAYQERLLSVRNLHVLDDQIAWECNTTIYLESLRGRQTDPDHHLGKSIMTRYIHQAMVTPISKPSREEVWQRIGVWNERVLQELSVKDFTHQTDRLPALSGLATAIEIPELGPYFAGVWSYNPFLSMTWWLIWQRNVHDKRYRGPSWSAVGLQDFINWAGEIWNAGKPQNQILDWEAWDRKFGPRLIDKKMVYRLKNPDPKGEVLEGSHLIMTGFCRTAYVAPRPETEFMNDSCRMVVEKGMVNPRGLQVVMDVRRNDLAYAASFHEDLADVKEKIEIDEVKSYLCVQIARERREGEQNPKIFALVLESMQGEMGQDAFRRVGLLGIDDVEKEKWVKRTLKLF